jgi:hypothetical protein
MQERKKPRRAKKGNRVGVRVILVVVLLAVIAGYYVYSVRYQPAKGETSTTSSSFTTSSGQTVSNITIGATVPPGYTMGNLIDFNLQGGVTILFMHGQGASMSIRFTAQLSDTVKRIVVNGYAASGNPRLEVGLQGDVNGTPSGSWLGGGGNYAVVSLPGERSFVLANLSSPVQVSSGRVYQIVLRVENGSVGEVGIAAFVANSPYQPLNMTDPDINWRDNQINTLNYTAGTWEVLNQYPIFVLVGTDGRMMGQPYSLAAPWVIFGSTYAGERIVPASNYRVGTIAFVVSSQGKPTGNLSYEIMDSTGKVLASGFFASPNQVPQLFWTRIEANLTTPVTLQEGRLYRIVLMAPGTNLTNAYQLIGEELTYSYPLGYGGLQDQLVSTTNGGAIWNDWNDADAMFSLTTVA